MSNIFDELLLSHITGKSVKENDQGWVSLHSLHSAMAGNPEKCPEAWANSDDGKEILEAAIEIVDSFEGPDISDDGEVFVPEVVAVSFASWLSVSFQVMALKTYTELSSETFSFSCEGGL